MTPTLEAVLGNRSAAQTLLFLEAYGPAYASRIATTFDVPVNGIQRQLLRFEASGVLVSHLVGRTRLFEFNTRNPTVRSLQVFLESELESLPDNITQAYFRQRQRPRRTGKDISSNTGH